MGRRLIERWFLKTTINLALQEPGSGIDLSDEIVRRQFGLALTPRSQGFFAIADLNEHQTYQTSVGFEVASGKVRGNFTKRGKYSYPPTTRGARHCLCLS